MRRYTKVNNKTGKVTEIEVPHIESAPKQIAGLYWPNIPEGFALITGENGVGKTTLIRALEEAARDNAVTNNASNMVISVRGDHAPEASSHPNDLAVEQISDIILSMIDSQSTASKMFVATMLGRRRCTQYPDLLQKIRYDLNEFYKKQGGKGKNPPILKEYQIDPSRSPDRDVHTKILRDAMAIMLKYPLAIDNFDINQQSVEMTLKNICHCLVSRYSATAKALSTFSGRTLNDHFPECHTQLRMNLEQNEMRKQELKRDLNKEYGRDLSEKKMLEKSDKKRAKEKDITNKLRHKLVRIVQFERSLKHPVKRINEELKALSLPLRYCEDKFSEMASRYYFSPAHNAGKEILFDDLSSGQKMLLKLLAVRCQYFITNNHQQRKHIIFLDEMDKHFHPTSIHKFMQLIRTLVSFGAQVIATTHRVETLAYAEDNELFTMMKKRVLNRISGKWEHKTVIDPANKLLAISRMSRSLNSVTGECSIVYVEGEEDANFYNPLYKILKRFVTSSKEIKKRRPQTLDSLTAYIAGISLRYQMEFRSVDGTHRKSGGCDSVRKTVSTTSKYRIGDQHPHRQYLGRTHIFSNMSLLEQYGVGGRFGLVDLDYPDTKTKPNRKRDSEQSIEDRIVDLKRHSLESYVFDPIMMASCFSTCSHIDRWLGVAGSKTSIQLANVIKRIAFHLSQLRSYQHEIQDDQSQRTHSTSREIPTNVAKPIVDKINECLNEYADKLYRAYIEKNDGTVGQVKQMLVQKYIDTENTFNDDHRARLELFFDLLQENEVLKLHAAISSAIENKGTSSTNSTVSICATDQIPHDMFNQAIAKKDNIKQLKKRLHKTKTTKISIDSFTRLCSQNMRMSFGDRQKFLDTVKAVMDDQGMKAMQKSTQDIYDSINKQLNDPRLWTTEAEVYHFYSRGHIHSIELLLPTHLLKIQGHTIEALYFENDKEQSRRFKRWAIDNYHEMAVLKKNPCIFFPGSLMNTMRELSMRIRSQFTSQAKPAKWQRFHASVKSSTGLARVGKIKAHIEAVENSYAMHCPHHLRIQATKSKPPTDANTGQMDQVCDTLLDQHRQISLFKRLGGVNRCSTIHVAAGKNNLFSAIKLHDQYNGDNKLVRKKINLTREQYDNIMQAAPNSLPMSNSPGVDTLRMLANELDIEFRLFKPGTHQHRQSHFVRAHPNNRVIYNQRNPREKTIIRLAHMLQAKRHDGIEFDHFEPLIINENSSVHKQIDTFNFGSTKSLKWRVPEEVCASTASTPTRLEPLSNFPDITATISAVVMPAVMPATSIFLDTRSPGVNSPRHRKTDQTGHIIDALFDHSQQSSQSRSVTGTESRTSISVPPGPKNLFQAIKSYFDYSGLNERYSDFNYRQYCDMTQGDDSDTMALVTRSEKECLKILSKKLNIEFRVFEHESHQHRQNLLTAACFPKTVIYLGTNDDSKAIVCLTHMLQTSTHGLGGPHHYEPFVIVPGQNVQHHFDRLNFGPTDDYQHYEPQAAYSDTASTASASALDTTSLASHSILAAPPAASTAEASTDSLNHTTASSLPANTGAASVNLSKAQKRRRRRKKSKSAAKAQAPQQTQTLNKHNPANNTFGSLSF